MLCISTLSFGQVIQKGSFNRSTVILDSIARYAQTIIHSVDGSTKIIRGDSIHRYNVPANAIINNKAIVNMDKRLNTIQYNLLEYHQEVQMSFIFGGLSIGLGMLSTAIPIEENEGISGIEAKRFMYILSGMSALAGTVLYIDSYKWIKRASIGTNLNGVAITIDF